MTSTAGEMKEFDDIFFNEVFSDPSAIAASLCNGLLTTKNLDFTNDAHKDGLNHAAEGGFVVEIEDLQKLEDCHVVNLALIKDHKVNPVTRGRAEALVSARIKVADRDMLIVIIGASSGERPSVWLEEIKTISALPTLVDDSLWKKLRKILPDDVARSVGAKRSHATRQRMKTDPAFAAKVIAARPAKTSKKAPVVYTSKSLAERINEALVTDDSSALSRLPLTDVTEATFADVKENWLKSGPDCLEQMRRVPVSFYEQYAPEIINALTRVPHYTRGSSFFGQNKVRLTEEGFARITERGKLLLVEHGRDASVALDHPIDLTNLIGELAFAVIGGDTALEIDLRYLEMIRVGRQMETLAYVQPDAEMVKLAKQAEALFTGVTGWLEGKRVLSEHSFAIVLFKTLSKLSTEKLAMFKTAAKDWFGPRMEAMLPGLLKDRNILA